MSGAFDQVRVEVTVAAPPATAFEVFTTETDLWWRRGPQYRVSGRQMGLLAFEPGIGGRLMETFETESGPRVAVTGRITAWDPPAFLAFEWRAANFAEADPNTLVEVRFEEVRPGRTRVALTHRAWSTVRPDHPARHALDGPGFQRMLGLWWSGLLTSLRERIGG